MTDDKEQKEPIEPPKPEPRRQWNLPEKPITQSEIDFQDSYWINSMKDLDK